MTVRTKVTQYPSPRLVRVVSTRPDLDLGLVKRAWESCVGTLAPPVVLTAPNQLSAIKKSTEGDVELLHIPLGTGLDFMAAGKLAERTDDATVGILHGETEILLQEGGRPAWRQFISRPVRRHDEPLYIQGGTIRRRWEREGGSVPLPNQVYLGLTQSCNRSCRFCVSREFLPAQFDLETLRGIAHELRHNLRLVALTGAGEAMVHPQFWKVVELLTEIVPGLELKMNTSGLALTKNADRLMEWPFRNITVSLNATTESTYQRFVGKGLERVLTGIRALVAARARSGRGDLHITLSMVLMRSTLPELSEMVDLAFRLGVEEIQGIYLMIHDENLALESLWLDQEGSNCLLDAAADRAAALGVIANLPPRFGCRSESPAIQISSLPTTEGQACVEAWSIAYLRPDGNLVACPYGERPLGNVRDAGFEAVWNGDLYTDLRRRLADRDYWGMCRHCAGFNESGHVDDFGSHWLGDRRSRLPVVLEAPLRAGEER